MKIRQFRNDDVDAILQISELSFAPIHQSFRHLLGDDIFSLVYPDWRKSQRAYIKSLCMGKDRNNILVVENGGHVIGFISYFVNRQKHSGELGLNAVHPNYRGKGIGPRMYRHVLMAMKEKGVRIVSVGTGGDNSHSAAHRAYEKCGFTPLPLTRFYKKL